MSDLVKNPEDRFSRVAAHMSRCLKINLVLTKEAQARTLDALFTRQGEWLNNDTIEGF